MGGLHDGTILKYCDELDALCILLRVLHIRISAIYGFPILREEGDV